MKQINLLEDISTLTKIPVNILYTIANTAEKNICHGVYDEFVLSEKNSIMYDIGIGDLIILLDSDNEFLSYEFKPNKKFEKDLIQTLTNNTDILTESIESNLKNKILSLYKELV